MRIAVIGVLLAAATVGAAADLTPIVDPYVRIQQALNADSLSGVKAEATAIAAEAEKLGADGAAIRAAALQLAKAGNLKNARAAFGKLGDAIMIEARGSGASVGDGVKVAYCPMLQKYWLQKADKVQNPFYGSTMPDCGRFNAEIPDLKE